MVNSQKWLGEGAKGILSPGSKSLPRVFCTIRNPFCTGATPFCTGASPFSLPGLKRPFAPSPNHFRAFTIFGLSLPELSDCKATLDSGDVCSCGSRGRHRDSTYLIHTEAMILVNCIFIGVQSQVTLETLRRSQDEELGSIWWSLETTSFLITPVALACTYHQEE